MGGVIKFSAISVYLGMLTFFLVVLLNDVKFSSEAFVKSLDFKGFFVQSNLGPLATVAGTIFAYFSIVILNLTMDFLKYINMIIKARKH